MNHHDVKFDDDIPENNCVRDKLILRQAGDGDSCFSIEIPIRLQPGQIFVQRLCNLILTQIAKPLTHWLSIGGHQRIL